NFLSPERGWLRRLHCSFAFADTCLLSLVLGGRRRCRRIRFLRKRRAHLDLGRGLLCALLIALLLSSLRLWLSCVALHGKTQCDHQASHYDCFLHDSTPI